MKRGRGGRLLPGTEKALITRASSRSAIRSRFPFDLIDVNIAQYRSFILEISFFSMKSGQLCNALHGSAMYV